MKKPESVSVQLSNVPYKCSVWDQEGNLIKTVKNIGIKINHSINQPSATLDLVRYITTEDMKEEYVFEVHDQVIWENIPITKFTVV